MIEETVLLNFEIDQGQAEKELVKTNKAILQNKEAQQELNKAYKEGAISQDEYVQENIRLQQNLKKNQDQSKALNKLIDTESNSRNAVKNRVAALVKEYDNLNLTTAHGIRRQKELEKELLSLNSTITKTSKSAGLFKDQIGNYPDSFKNAAQSINVAGVSVGDVGAKLAAFSNPATAAIGIVTALGAAYARSTIGAKDLEFAQNTLSASITFTTNRFAELISSAEDGQGILSKLTDLFVGGVFGIGTLVDSKLTALNIEKLQDLEREEIGLRDKINDRLETNQELLTDIQAEQTVYNDKIFKADNIVDNLRANESELLDIKAKQLQIIELQLNLNKNDEVVQTQLLEKQREISNIERDTEKRVQAILRLKQNINEAEQKRIALEQKKVSDFTKKANDFVNERDRVPEGELKFNDDPTNEPPAVDPLLFDVKKREQAEKEHNQIIKELFGERETLYIQDRESFEEQQRLKQQAEEASLNVTSGVLEAAASLFDEQSTAYKILATGQTLISTYATAQKAYEAAFVPPTIASPALGAGYAALAVAQGLANVAAINGVEFAEGGYTGSGGKYEPAGIVHKGEYVAPQHVMSNPSAAPHINALESMRLRGYADGGFVANQAAAPANNAMLIANVMKNQPPIYASWVEGEKVGRKLNFKQEISSI